MNPTAAPAVRAKFDAFAPGTRIRFTTHTGKGYTHTRTGTVTRVTAQSLHVECDPLHLPPAARLTRKGWINRDPKMLLKDTPTVTRRPLPTPRRLSEATHRLRRHAALAACEPLFADLEAAVDASHMPRGRQIVAQILERLEGAFEARNHTTRAAAVQVLGERLNGRATPTVRTALLRDAY